mgnify:CR=1 FL=1
MNKQGINKNKEQVLTDKMDVGTREFNEFQAILLNKSKERSNERKKMIELMALKFKMEDYLSSKDKHSKLVGDKAELNKEHQLAIKETNEQIKLIVTDISQKSIAEAEKKLMECQNNINATIKEEKVKLHQEIKSFNKNIEKIANDAANNIVEKIYYTKPNTNNLKNIISKHSESYKND